MNPIDREDINSGRSAAYPGSPSFTPPRIHYLAPAIIGPLTGWSACIERSARLGFSHILTAPICLPGHQGDATLTLDHERCDPRIAQAGTLETLAIMAGLTQRHGLGLMIDIHIHQVHRDCALVQQFSPLIDRTRWDLPPDPRQTIQISQAAYFAHYDETLLAWWADHLIAWAGQNVAGFRCVDAHRVPGSFWRQLIDRVKQLHKSTLFIASFHGATASEAQNLAGCGFDIAESSSWAWDFRAAWINEDMRRTKAIGLPLAMPALPRLTPPKSSRPDLTLAHQRAMVFAAHYAPSWMMPMGDAISATSPATENELIAANAASQRFSELPAGDIIAPSGTNVAILRRAKGASPGMIGLINSALDRDQDIADRWVWARRDGRTLIGQSEHEATTGMIHLTKGQIRIMEPGEADDVKIPRPRISAKIFADAPRIAIEMISPAVDHGKFPAKRIVGETVTISADILCDGHDQLAADLLWRAADQADWQIVPMALVNNDRWQAQFPLRRIGRYVFTIEAWKDRFASFTDELAKKHAAGLSLTLELQEGVALLKDAAQTSQHRDLTALYEAIQTQDAKLQTQTLLAPSTSALMRAHDIRPFLIRHDKAIPIDAERSAAAYSAWYELFPRSQSGDATRHGRFADVITRLPAIQDMGFDVLYFPPIHPIGRSHRKGKNNALIAGPDDPGSPYAIGSAEGGHDAIHPELGTLDEFRQLIAAAAAHGIEIALDFAIQCSPDHPWLAEHPGWFAWRPDGTIRHAENPPKKYEDIVNVDFYGADAIPSLWLALRDVVLFWVRQGVHIFRVDNPHTKPLPFWQWMISDIRAQHPQVIFLAEAFTRPKIMYRLAKVGFSQSYTYFTWRHTAAEFRDYLTELTQTAPRDFFRPHFFVNTPDINPVFLHGSGRPGFLIRAALAATLSGLWGVYSGFELCESEAVLGKEEYLNSEKYEIRAWDWQRPGNIIAEITRLNKIRAENPALQTHLNVQFLPSSNDQILLFQKSTPDGSNIIMVAINLDPYNTQNTTIHIAATQDHPQGEQFTVDDLLTDSHFTWFGRAQSITLDPHHNPYAIWRMQADSTS